MKAIGNYLASNALLIALVILACYQQYQLLELSRDVSWMSSDVEEARDYAYDAQQFSSDALDEASKAAFYGESNNDAVFYGERNRDRLIELLSGLEAGVYTTYCR